MSSRPPDTAMHPGQKQQTEGTATDGKPVPGLTVGVK